ncbi:LytTR family DNA-binding domain-containing protein [Spirosoma endophyticum]|uniref:LytTr DNA-binding domain-containing protein n=1 Tax=Spirosoma endophyticum TaxID=662367 RepID=A0A1I1N579_9BACT|nr:LytTR family DNA-binding domain-containing protein [Spirosoma endophyticum]SFC89963.1 LytTr DNA-binding domain-containing protein [Spirosoma endophyticum]
MAKLPKFPGKLSLKQQASIVRISGSGNYSLIYLQDGQSILFSYSMKCYEDFLPNFIRTHKQHMVNPAFVTSVRQLGPKEVYLVMLPQKDVIPIARRRINEVLRVLINNR